MSVLCHMLKFQDSLTTKTCVTLIVKAKTILTFCGEISLSIIEDIEDLFLEKTFQLKYEAINIFVYNTLYYHKYW